MLFLLDICGKHKVVNSCHQTSESAGIAFLERRNPCNRREFLNGLFEGEK